MTAKQILHGMSKGEWKHVGNGEIESQNNWIVDCVKLNIMHRHEPNANAITTAVNSTYGLNYDPTQMDAMYKMLERVDSGAEIELNEIQELLNKVKIQ